MTNAILLTLWLRKEIEDSEDSLGVTGRREKLDCPVFLESRGCLVTRDTRVVTVEMD